MKVEITEKQAEFMRKVAKDTVKKDTGINHTEPIKLRKSGFSKQGEVISNSSVSVEFSSKEFKNNRAASIIYNA